MYLSPWILGLMALNIEMVRAVLPSIKSKVICLTAQGSTSTSKVATTTSSFTIPIPYVSTYTPTTTVTPKAITTISIVTAISTTTATLAQVTDTYMSTVISLSTVYSTLTASTITNTVIVPETTTTSTVTTTSTTTGASFSNFIPVQSSLPGSANSPPQQKPRGLSRGLFERTSPKISLLKPGYPKSVTCYKIVKVLFVIDTKTAKSTITYSAATPTISTATTVTSITTATATLMDASTTIYTTVNSVITSTTTPDPVTVLSTTTSTTLVTATEMVVVDFKFCGADNFASTYNGQQIDAYIDNGLTYDTTASSDAQNCCQMCQTLGLSHCLNAFYSAYTGLCYAAEPSDSASCNFNDYSSELVYGSRFPFMITAMNGYCDAWTSAIPDTYVTLNRKRTIL